MSRAKRVGRAVKPRKAVELLVGPMRPPVAGGDYDRAFHSFEVLSAASLGVSYEDPHRVVLVPMRYDDGRRARAVEVKRPRARSRRGPT